MPTVLTPFLQVRDWGLQGPAHDVLQDYLKANK